MVLQILLITSIVLQLIAATIAVRLMSKTKYNASWILFTIALVVMSVIRCAEYIQLVWDKELNVPQDFFVWMGVVTSLCFAVAVFLVKKIFNWAEKLDFQHRLTQKRILNTVLRTEEKERLRFSKELHDGLGPLLSSARLSLSALKKDDVVSPQNRVILENTNYVIQEAIYSLREISNNLSPHILNNFGLGRGVTNFINKLPSKGEFKVNFKTNLKSERFSTDVEVILYRVICELINNSIKHSEGSKIDLSMQYADDKIEIEYSDNGKGFNPEAMMNVGMGLSNISSRISSLKGSCQIKSVKNGGMQASIMVNLKENDNRRGEKQGIAGR